MSLTHTTTPGATTGTDAGFDLNALIEFDRNATPAPWEAIPQSDDDLYHMGYFIRAANGDPISDDNTAPRDVDALLIVEMRNALPALIALVRRAAPATSGNWRDKLRWSKANTDYHGFIAFTPGQLEHFVSMLVGDWLPQPATSGSASGECSTCRDAKWISDPRCWQFERVPCPDCATTTAANAVVAVDERARDAILERALQAVAERAGDADKISLFSAFEAIRALKKNRCALPEPIAQQAASHPVQAGDAVDERALFEAWHRSKFATKHSTGQPTRDMHNGIYDENYGPKDQQQMWEVWQARASLAPVSAQQDIGEIWAEAVADPEFVREIDADRATVSAQQGAAEQHNAVECDSALRAEPAGQHDANLAAAFLVKELGSISMSLAADLVSGAEYTFQGCDYLDRNWVVERVMDWRAAWDKTAEARAELTSRCRAEGGNTSDNKSSNLAAKAPAAQAGAIYQFSSLGEGNWSDCTKAFYDDCPKYKYHRRIVYASPATAPEAMTSDQQAGTVDCRSHEGIASGLIDGVIATARILRTMDQSHPAVVEALKDLRADEDVALLFGAVHTQQPVARGEFPAGALHNGEAYAERLENIYDFECEAGPLRNCSEWVELRRCMQHVARYLAAPAPAGVEGAKPLAHGHREDYYLMANARRLAEKPIHEVRTMPNWVLAKGLFATGSTSAYQICRDAGIDPDGYKVERTMSAHQEPRHE
jgi:hypothetical protein